MSVDSNSNEEEVYFEDDKIKCEHYIVDKLKFVNNSKLEFGKTYMNPIIRAFKKKMNKEETNVVTSDKINI